MTELNDGLFQIGFHVIHMLFIPYALVKMVIKAGFH